VESFLNYCPRCGKQDIDAERHGSPGIGMCRACGTLFSVMSVRMGEKVVPVSPEAHPVAGAEPAPAAKKNSES